MEKTLEVRRPAGTAGESIAIWIAVRRIASGGASRVFGYSGHGNSETLGHVVEQACRVAAGLPGTCEIEIRTFDPLHRLAWHSKCRGGRKEMRGLSTRRFPQSESGCPLKLGADGLCCRWKEALSRRQRVVAPI